MKIFNKILLYVCAIAHTPFTLLRVIVASVILIDGWCDKVIHGFTESVEKELESEEQ